MWLVLSLYCSSRIQSLVNTIVAFHREMYSFRDTTEIHVRFILYEHIFLVFTFYMALDIHQFK